ncbi:MAG: PilZ domain-containing protein [Gammaproteobacteria bacterium]|nr:PilZ domain-containing protein [Gammaproteobacteria bacterium]
MVTGNAGEVFPPVGPVLSGEFPLRWEHVSPLQLEQERNRANDSNEITLRNYYLLDERIQEPSDDRDESAPELVRIEQRLNLVIELLGQVLAHSLDLPAAVSCILSRASFEWSSYDVPTVGECVRLTLYLHPHYPKPLVLFGQVTHVVRSETTSRATAQLAQLSDAVGDWLDRLIFRAHRRRIALTRREKSR